MVVTQKAGAVQGVFVLRPSVTNPKLWRPKRPSQYEWVKIRRRVLERDNYTCLGCGHRAFKYMNIHHLGKGSDNRLRNLRTLCVACHAVLHIGLNLQYGVIEIWNSQFTQVEIIKRIRALVAKGLALQQIKRQLQLKKGPLDPDSINYANNLIAKMGDAPRAYLDKPLCAVFVMLDRWQIDDSFI